MAGEEKPCYSRKRVARLGVLKLYNVTRGGGDNGKFGNVAAAQLNGKVMHKLACRYRDDPMRFLRCVCNECNKSSEFTRNQIRLIVLLEFVKSKEPATVVL